MPLLSADDCVAATVFITQLINILDAIMNYTSNIISEFYAERKAVGKLNSFRIEYSKVLKSLNKLFNSGRDITFSNVVSRVKLLTKNKARKKVFRELMKCINFRYEGNHEIARRDIKNFDSKVDEFLHDLLVVYDTKKKQKKKNKKSRREKRNIRRFNKSSQIIEKAIETEKKQLEEKKRCEVEYEIIHKKHKKKNLGLSIAVKNLRWVIRISDGDIDQKIIAKYEKYSKNLNNLRAEYCNKAAAKSRAEITYNRSHKSRLIAKRLLLKNRFNNDDIPSIILSYNTI